MKKINALRVQFMSLSPEVVHPPRPRPKETAPLLVQ